MTVPQFYRGKGEGVIPTYDFFDLATGIGYKRLYLGDTRSGYNATSWEMASNQWYTCSGATVAVGGAALDIDFNMNLNLPMLIKGQCLTGISLVRAKGGGTGSVPASIMVALSKVSDGAETFLISGGYLITSDVSVDTFVNNMVGLKLDIPKTHFKKGDTFKCNIKSQVADANSEIRIMHDPFSRAKEELDMGSTTGGTLYRSSSTLLLPIVVDK